MMVLDKLIIAAQGAFLLDLRARSQFLPMALSSYCSESLKGEVAGFLKALPSPIERAEILSVTPPLESGECISVTRFFGPQEEVLFRAVWVESDNQLLMQAAQIVERTVR
jgi:hypothetical protein